MKENLSEIEIKKVEQFCKDEKMFGAVVKVLLAGLYYQGTPEAGLPEGEKIKNGAYSLVAQSSTYPVTDEVIGQNLKAQWAGLNLLKNALDELKSIKADVKAIETPYENEGI